MRRKNLIDGLPVSYDFNYVIKTEKCCKLCSKLISADEIENNSIACTENFEFLHKECLDPKDYELVYSKPKDPTSMIKLMRKKNDELSQV